ncbi:hypothetical protein [Photobacterium ganghwense]|uniref:hypothetical protein n=1 Tax=Photobacterium ganghwense TaxID=320778 RepID=UPI001C2D2BE2|nr:hypothetical protein [Photobacterium ganghwense]MBV1842210.1 hypothetical protein [Photobacterium ganghwense]
MNLQNEINDYVKSVYFSSKFPEDQEGISTSIALIKGKVIERFFSKQRSLKARKAKTLRKLYVEVLLREKRFGEDCIGQLIYREPLFDTNTPPNVLHGKFDMSELKKHQLFSENHSDKGYHVHLLNKAKKRYQVIFTAVTSMIDEKNVDHDVYWEPHAEGHADLTIDIPSRGKSVRIEIYNGVVKLLSGFSNDNRKQKSNKSQLLSTA